MKQLFLLLLLLSVVYSCGSDSEGSPGKDINQTVDNQGWSVPIGLINGSGRPFALAKDPLLFPVKDIDFIADDALVAVVNMGNETRIYPYSYLSKFESVNDNIGDVSFSMTYCPITHSALVMNRDYRDNNFVLRASGYLLNDNVILWDEASESFWSQMLVQSVKGPYTNEFNTTFNFIEMTWNTVRENFPDAMVFSLSSITNSSQEVEANKPDVKLGDDVYGVLGRSLNQKIGSAENVKNTKIFIYHYDDFGENTTLLFDVIANKQTLIIGNRDEHYITSYINDGNAEFEAVQNEFPIVMKDSDDNYWNVFGVAVEGPRAGERLVSPIAFFALFWAWDEFYDDFIFVD